MQILETHALSEKEARELSCSYLEVEPDEIEIELVEKGSTGFLGLGNKTPSLFYIHSIDGKTPLESVIKGSLSTILHKMGYRAGVKKIEKLDDGKTYVEMTSQHAGYIIGKRGKTLESLQFALNLCVERFLGEQPKILLDIENYRSRREKQVENMARKNGEAVKKSGRSRLLPPLNPYERRLVHMALQEIEGIETESQGDGLHKRVKIFPVGLPDAETDESENYDDFDDNRGNLIEPEDNSESTAEKQPDHYE